MVLYSYNGTDQLAVEHQFDVYQTGSALPIPRSCRRCYQPPIGFVIS
jgi:hypothetical protein